MKNLFIAWLSLLLYGCTTFPQAVKPTTGGHPSPTEIYIVSHGWHTGIIAPAHDVNTVLPQLKKRFAQETQWYEIGWGDKGFYQSQEITTALTLQAMFWSSGAVMHIVAFSGKPERYFAGSEIKSLLLHTNQRNSLMRYLGRSFARDAEGNLIPLKQGIYGDSQFYAANDRYGILNTCNKWTAKGLESAGLTINPSLKLTAGSVMKAITDHRMCLNKYCYP
ncbi:TIGR02117 family protein [Salmonella enterica subsp. enterica serovar Gaminara]|nr:TIGR02117 family protein [Salmonella enterica subsp. enterica serovar Gaminara]